MTDDDKNKPPDLQVVPSDALGNAPEDASVDASEDVVLVRRIDRRLEASAKSDYPWTRRIVGFAIIGAAFFFGWRMLNRQSTEIVKRHRQQAAMESRRAALEPTPAPIATPSPPSTAATSDVSSAIAYDGAALTRLSSATLNTIAECTKGANAFRSLDLAKDQIDKGEATLESVFKPVLEPKGKAKRQVQLQNVRIRTKSGEELRLHAAPKTQNGKLFLQLFRVADDGLPEPIEFPDRIRDLKDQPLSDDAVTQFLQLSEVPGRAIEVERHESWSYPEKAGAQVIWSGDNIADLQVFTANAFLACARTTRAGGEFSVMCKCVPR